MENIFWQIGHELKICDIENANGITITSKSGKSYVDLESGVWCTPLGHCHPQVNQAIKEQLDSITHTGYCYAHPVIQKTAQMLLDITGLNTGKCLFLLSGSEAVEVGVKAIQSTIDKPYILTFHDSFLGSLGSSGKRPENEWILFDWSVCRTCDKDMECGTDCAHFNTIPFTRISGFVFEPGSASGMVKFPPEKIVRQIVKHIQNSGGAVQVNEITTGIGRTGKWFGFQHYEIKPDIVSLGKGLGNGYPVSAAIFNSKMIKQMDDHDFYHSQSHQNDPLGCAAARAVIETIHKEDLLDQCIEKGRYLLQQLNALKQKHCAIKEVRGKGLMIAVDFHENVLDETVLSIYDALIDNGYIVAKRPNLKTFRIDPPLICALEIFDDFTQTFDTLLSKETS